MIHQIRIGALCWVLTVEFFIAQFIAQAAWPEYSASLHDISVLGLVGCPATGPVTCSPLNLVFNGGIVLNGLLTLAGLWLTRPVWGRSPAVLTALWLLAVGGGAGSIMVGLFPLDFSLPLHMVGAILALFVACFGLILLGITQLPRNRIFAVYTIAIGCLTLLAFVLYAMGVDLGFGRGIMERVAAWPHTIWYMVTGSLILLGRLDQAPA